MAVNTTVSGPISGVICRATSSRAGAFTAMTTRSCTPRSAGLALAVTALVVTVPPLFRRSPWALSASRVLPRATTLTSLPALANLAPIQPPMAPAP